MSRITEVFYHEELEELEENEGVVLLLNRFALRTSEDGVNFEDRDCVGGKTVFSWDNAVMAAYATSGIIHVLESMNGLYCDGEFRSASDAYNIFLEDYSTEPEFEHLVMDGGDSTLAPSPVWDTPCWPVGSGAGASGIGYIKFDTKMDTSISACNVLSVYISGTASVTNIQWEGNDKIKFNYSGPPGYYIFIQALSGGVIHSSGCVQLNGNRKNGNGDNFYWYFAY